MRNKEQLLGLYNQRTKMGFCFYTYPYGEFMGLTIELPQEEHRDLVAYLITQKVTNEDLTPETWSALVEHLEPMLLKYIEKNGRCGMSTHHSEKLHEAFRKIME